MSQVLSRSVLFITGLSGAGISTTLKSLEDIGYEVFDNFPLSQVPSLLNEKGYEDQPVAFGFDSRTRAYSPETVIETAKLQNATIVFLTASNAVIQKRFSETRRVHPLAKDRTVTDGIVYEREWLGPLREAADRLIDTTDLSVHDLKRLIEADFQLGEKGHRLSVTVMSFGFKYGVPREVDMMFDARFLRNPHWDLNLKPLSGKDQAVRDYVRADDGFAPFFEKVSDLSAFLLPRYAHEGKSYLTIAFGCTGGQHRSVFLAETLAKTIEGLGYPVQIRHRDLGD